MTDKFRHWDGEKFILLTREEHIKLHKGQPYHGAIVDTKLHGSTYGAYLAYCKLEEEKQKAKAKEKVEFT